MNQILSSGGANKNDKKDKAVGTETSVAVKKIVIVFAIIISIFGIILIGMGVTSIVKQGMLNAKSNKIPTVNIVQEEEKIKIEIEHDKSIATIKYNWNDGNSVEIQGAGRTKLEEKIDLPEGDNTLNLEVLDINGVSTKFTKKYSFESSDKTPPEIETLLDNGQLKIVAKDTVKMQVLTYQWDNGEIITLDPDASDVKKIETRIEVIKGEHTINITAKDSNGNEVSKSFTFKGANKPQIALLQDGNILKITITDEEALKTIVYTLNGNEVTIDGENKKEIIKEETLIEGKNEISITVTNSSGLQSTVNGYCNYP